VATPHNAAEETTGQLATRPEESTTVEAEDSGEAGSPGEARTGDTQLLGEGEATTESSTTAR
jgi:hypothetical protein